MPDPDFERFWRRLRGPSWPGVALLGRPGFRDPDGRCDEFDGKGYDGKGTCHSDGHYLCDECSHLSPSAPRFTEYGRDGRKDRLRLFWRRPMVAPMEIEALCRRFIQENPERVEDYRRGKSVLGFFVGKVMTETRGTAEPRAVSEVYRRLLNAA